MTNERGPSLDDILKGWGDRPEPTPRPEPVPSPARQPAVPAVGQLPPGVRLAYVKDKVPVPALPAAESSSESGSRRGRAVLVMGLVGLVAVGAGAAWYFNPGDGQKPVSSGVEQDINSVVQPVPSDLPLPPRTPDAEPELVGGTSETLTDSSSPTDKPSESQEASESAEPSDKPSNKPKKSPKNPPAEPTPLIKESSFLTASADIAGVTSRDVTRVLKATLPEVLGVTNANDSQFKNIPEQLGESFMTIPANYGQNRTEGRSFMTFDSSKLRLLEQGSVEMPGAIATSLKDFNTSTPYGLFREIPTEEEKEQGLKGQLMLYVNLDLIEEELPWVVQKTKGKLSENGNTKRAAQMQAIDDTVRTIVAGFEEKYSQKILVVLQGDLGVRQSSYKFTENSPDCFFTRTVGDEVQLESSSAMEAGTSACEDSSVKASTRRAYVGVDEGIEKVIATVRRDGTGVRVLLTNIQRNEEMTKPKGGS